MTASASPGDGPLAGVVESVLAEPMLLDLCERLTNAAESLGHLADSAAFAISEARLRGKREGVLLAKSYAEETLRDLPAIAQAVTTHAGEEGAVERAAVVLHQADNPAATPGFSCAECRRTARVLAAAGLLAAHAEVGPAPFPCGCTEFCSWCVERPEDGPCELHHAEVGPVGTTVSEDGWKPGDPCGACGSTSTHGPIPGCRTCGRSDADDD